MTPIRICLPTQWPGDRILPPHPVNPTLPRVYQSVYCTLDNASCFWTLNCCGSAKECLSVGAHPTLYAKTIRNCAARSNRSSAYELAKPLYGVFLRRNLINVHSSFPRRFVIVCLARLKMNIGRNAEKRCSQRNLVFTAIIPHCILLLHPFSNPADKSTAAHAGNKGGTAANVVPLRFPRRPPKHES